MKHIKTAFVVLIFVTLAKNVMAQIKKSSAVKKTVIVKKNISAQHSVIKKILGVRVKLTTDSGIVIIRLYDSTILHRDNFVKLVSAHFYDSLLFHRVIKDFMIQGGDPLSKNAPVGAMLGNGGGNMPTIPAEFKPTLFHKKGVIAAARDNNPQKASNACQFYIVQGKKFTDIELNNFETQSGIKFTPEKRIVYKTIGGTPFLDMNYTVFGEVEKGLEVIDKIANTPCDENNRPIVDIRMKIELMK